MPSAGDRRIRRRPAARGAVACAAFLVAAAAAGRASAAEPLARPGRVRVELRAHVEVERPRLTLGDVAEIDAADAAAARRLAGLEIGAAPRAGVAVRLRRDRLARWLRARAAARAGEVEWAGPATTEVRLRVRNLAGESIAARAAAGLREALASRGLRAEIAIGRTPADVSLPGGELALALRPIPPEVALARRASVWVDVRVANRFVRTVPVELTVAAYGPACVATREEPAGRTLDPEAVAVREVEWSGRSAPPLDPAVAAGLRLRRRVRAGEVLTPSHVEPAPEVARGEWATVSAGAGAVRVEGRAEVLQDGVAGQAVRVRVPGATGDVLARVTGRGAVEVLR